MKKSPKLSSLIDKACFDYNLIEKGDRILIGASGGKDSTALISYFAQRAKRRSKLCRMDEAPDFEYKALFIKNDFATDFPLEIAELFKAWQAPFEKLEVNVLERVKKGQKMSCWWCSTQRRTELLNYAIANGYNKIALGHHMDDLLETLLMNMLNKGELASMPPRLKYEKFPVTIIRPSHTYDERSVPLGVHGEKGSWQVVKRIKEGKPVIIHGDGTSLWTITHNSDFAKGFVGLMANIHAIGEAVQIMSDESVTWNQIYQCIANSLNVELKPVYISSWYLANHAEYAPGKTYDFTGSLIGDKANSVVFDCGKLKSLVPDFVATKRADQGIRETIEYVLNHPECQTEDPEFDKWCDNLIGAMK